jgi:hypothetical protein
MTRASTPAKTRLRPSSRRDTGRDYGCGTRGAAIILPMPDGDTTGPRTRRHGARILYWLAVTVVSLALVVGLLLLMQSCDESTVGGVLVASP